MLKQMGRFSSKYGRYVFFILLVIVCFTFALTPGMLECEDPKTRHVAGVLFGEEVSQREFEDVKDRWHASRRLMGQAQKTRDVVLYTLDPNAGQDEEIPADLRATMGSWIRWQHLQRFLQGDTGEEEMVSFTWRVLAFLHEAKRAGIVVTDAEVANFIQDMFGGPKFDQQEYISTIEEMTQLSVVGFERTIHEALILSRYFGLIQDGAAVSAEEVYREYLKKNEKIRVRTVKFGAPEYEDLVRLVPTRHVVRPVDPFRRPYVIDSDAIFAHYLREKGPLTVAPKIRLEFAFAEYDRFLEGVTPPTEVEMRQRYDEERENYRIRTKDGVYKPFEEVKADLRKSLLDAITDERARQEYENTKEAKYKKPDGAFTPFEEVRDQIKKDLAAAVTDDAVKAEYEKNKAKFLIRDEDKRYKEFEEVKEQIRKALEKDQAAEKAMARIRAMRSDIDAMQLMEEDPKIDFAVLAAKHGLAYGKTPLFDEKHIALAEEILGSSDELKIVMRSVDDFAVGTILPERMDSTKGTFIARIDEKVDKFVPPLTVPIRRKLALSLVHTMGAKLAFRAAQDLHREARQRIDRAVEEWSKAHPEAKAEEREKALQALRRDVFERVVAERGLSVVEGSPVTRDDRTHGEMFDRPKYEIELLPKRNAPHEGEPDGYEQTYWVSQLVDQFQPDGKDYETAKRTLKDQLQGKRRTEYLESFLEVVWEEAKLEDRLHAKPVEENPSPDDVPQ